MTDISSSSSPSTTCRRLSVLVWVKMITSHQRSREGSDRKPTHLKCNNLTLHCDAICPWLGNWTVFCCVVPSQKRMVTQHHHKEIFRGRLKLPVKHFRVQSSVVVKVDPTDTKTSSKVGSRVSRPEPCRDLKASRHHHETKTLSILAPYGDHDLVETSPYLDQDLVRTSEYRGLDFIRNRVSRLRP